MLLLPWLLLPRAKSKFLQTKKEQRKQNKDLFFFTTFLHVFSEISKSFKHTELHMK